MIRTFSRFALSMLVAGIAPVPALATLTPTIERGEQLIKINEPGRTSSVCVIPRHFNKNMYSKRDLEKEHELCSLARGQNVAVCPKTSSSNPGLEFYKVPQGESVAQIESRNCFKPKPGDLKDNAYKRAAKYKSSVSCSYTPSILAYYHISRILGGAGDVPPAVLRTFDIEQHKMMGKKALSITKSSELINQTWAGFMSNMEAGGASKRKDMLFTDNIDQTYGALVLHDGGSDFYSEMFNGGKDQPTRYTNFKANNPVFKAIASSSQVSSLISRDFTAASAQKMQAMKDVADMIVLDTLLNQQDRLGNVDYQLKFAYLDRANLNSRGLPRLKFEKAKDPAEIAELKARGAVQIKVMNLRDNDCGVAKENHSRKFSMIEAVSHVSPLTYQRLLMLNQQADQPAVKDQFTRGMMFTGTDYNSFRSNLAHAAKILQSNCRSGKLKLDLDAEAHFAGQTPNTSCEI